MGERGRETMGSLTLQMSLSLVSANGQGFPRSPERRLWLTFLRLPGGRAAVIHTYLFLTPGGDASGFGGQVGYSRTLLREAIPGGNEGGRGGEARKPCRDQTGLSAP